MNRVFGWISASLLATLCCCTGCNVAATGHNVQGKRLYDQGQFAQAISTFQKAQQANPRNPDAYYNMGATYYHLGKQQRNATWLQQADHMYRQAISLDNQHAEAYRGLAALLVESGRSAEAFKMMQDWRMRTPQSAEPLIELARLHREYGDRTQAMQLLVDALNIESYNPRALKAMGQLREEAGEYQLALDNYVRSYQANNLQTDVAAKIASLQGHVQAHPVPFQPGQNRMGNAYQYVPR